MPRVSKRKNYTRQNKSVKRNTSRKNRSLKRNTSRKTRSLKRNTSKKLNRKSRSLRRKNLKGGMLLTGDKKVYCKGKYNELSNADYFSLEEEDLKRLYTLNKDAHCKNIFYRDPNTNQFQLIDDEGRPNDDTTVSQEPKDYSRIDVSPDPIHQSLEDVCRENYIKEELEKKDKLESIEKICLTMFNKDNESPSATETNTDTIRPDFVIPNPNYDSLGQVTTKKS
jgi:hypothetical protein